MFSSEKLKGLTLDTESLLQRSKGVDDIDLEVHLRELERYDLKSCEWKHRPLENAHHDYFSDLLERYLDDLASR